MTAYETGAETVLLGGEMGGDEGKDIQRDAVMRAKEFLQSRIVANAVEVSRSS
jgi:hypothetical protein